jgi:salicylate hydroxylase
VLRGRDTYDYTYTDWIYGPTALTPDQEPPMFPVFPLSSVEVDEPAGV